MKDFFEGFEKRSALMEDMPQNMSTDAAIGYLPLGTTISTAMGKRPKEHSRLSEWGLRVLGSGLGGTAGALIGAIPGVVTRNPELIRLGAAGGSVGGALGGEGFGSYLANKKYYDDKSGKLKKKYRKQY